MFHGRVTQLTSSEQHVAWRQNFHFRLSYSLKKKIYCWLNGTVTTMQMWFCCIPDVILFHLVQKVFTFPLFLFSEAVESIIQRITLESLATRAAKYNSIKLNHNILCVSFLFFLCLWLELSLSSKSRPFENCICGLVWSKTEWYIIEAVMRPCRHNGSGSNAIHYQIGDIWSYV